MMSTVLLETRRGLEEVPSQPAQWTVTYRCRINTIRPLDDEHSVAQNM